SGDRARSAEQDKQSSDSKSTASADRWILYGRYEPTSRARQMIKNREYRYVSAAFAKDYPDRKTGESQGLTLTSEALTNQPFLDELPEVWLPVAQPLLAGRAQAGVPVQQMSPRLSAEQGGEMPTLNMKCSAEGTQAR